LTNSIVPTKQGDCEVCPKTDIAITKHYGNIWFCEECWDKETKHQSPEMQQSRVETYRASVEASRLADAKIEVRTDLFNAATESIVNLKKMIDENAEITNKPYQLAKELLDRFNHFKQVVFDLNQQLVEANNEQKAIQVYLNQMANSLRAEEREQLKIQDINYKPNPVKEPKVKSIKTASSTKKLDKKLVAQYARELGVNEFTLQMVIVQMGGDIEKAVGKIRQSINEAKSMTK
jgi:hypothetical protein